MFFELIGTILAGVATALIFWAINRALGRHLPSWLGPVCAGIAMLLATISSEYGWFERTKATMPKGMIVAQTIEEAAVYRPWTYLKPFVTRFVAVDRAAMKTHPDQPNKRIVDLVFYGRWSRTAKVPVAFDCAEFKRADIVDGVDFGADGEIINVEWVAMDQSNPVLRAACAEA